MIQIKQNQERWLWTEFAIFICILVQIFICNYHLTKHTLVVAFSACEPLAILNANYILIYYAKFFEKIICTKWRTISYAQPSDKPSGNVSGTELGCSTSTLPGTPKSPRLTVGILSSTVVSFGDCACTTWPTITVMSSSLPPAQEYRFVRYWFHYIKSQSKNHESKQCLWNTLLVCKE